MDEVRVEIVFNRFDYHLFKVSKTDNLLIDSNYQSFDYSKNFPG